MSNVPVLQSVRAAIAFRRQHWRTAAGVLGAVAITATINTASGLTGVRLLSNLAEIAYVAATLVAYGALMRIALADEHAGDSEFQIGQQGFQWGKPETRLIGAAVLVGIVYVIAAVMMAFVVVLIFVAAGLSAAMKDPQSLESLFSALSPGSSALLGVALLAFAIGLVYFAIRISLAPAATLARKRISVFDTWALTKGQFFPILGATFLVNLPSLAAGALVNVLALGLGQAGTAKGAIQLDPMSAILIGAITGVVVGFVQLPLSVGLTAYLFRGLRPDGEAPQRLAQHF